MEKKSSQKEYIVKLKNTKLYLKSVDPKNIEYTFDLEKAEKTNKKDLKNFSKIDELEIIRYEDELYQVKSENYKLYIATILSSESDIKKEDLIDFCKEYEGESDLRGKFTSYITLKEKYPNSKLIDEIVRLGKIIDFKDNVLWYEARLSLSKDKEFIKDNNPIIISAEETDEYEQRKAYLDMVKQKYPFDYDVAKQYDILDNEFKHKYITQDIYKEFYEKQYEEEYEIPNT